MDKIQMAFLTYASDILGDTKDGLSGSNIIKLFASYAVEYNVNIPYAEYPFDASNKRTALLENLKKFSPEQQYEIMLDFCNSNKLPNPLPISIEQLKIQLIARYGSSFGNSVATTLNKSLVEETKSFLVDYPESNTLYMGALMKYNSKSFERNLLDDLRLSLELLLKKIFSNEKSIENQLSNIGKFISDKGGSKNFTNMFQKLNEYYANYQNSFVKHNDAVIEEEVEFIFEMTSSFIKHMIKMNVK